jgi:hypothetical protein
MKELDEFLFNNPIVYLIGCRTSYAKGQVISKGLFDFFNSSKKRTKNFCPSSLGQKPKLSSSFFGRIEDTKISFQV